MSNSNFDKLNFVDQHDYNKRMTICEYCRGIDECNINGNYGIKPVVIYRESVGKYALGGQLCGKQQGTVTGTYAKLVKEPLELYNNDERSSIIKSLSKGNGGFLYGNAGIGKSTILSNIASNLRGTNKDVYYELANKISGSVFEFKTRDETLNKAMNVDVLIIDDFGGDNYMSFKGFNTVYDCWSPILKSRIDNKKITYVTSNYSLKDLAIKIKTATDKVTADTIIDRIITLGVYNLKDKNHRLDDLE